MSEAKMRITDWLLGHSSSQYHDAARYIESLEKKLAEALMQRDTLVGALEMVTTHHYADGQCDNGYSPQHVAKKAIATIRGGES